MDTLCFKTAAELSVLLAKKELSAVELMNAYIKRSQSLDDRLNVFISTNPDEALEQAKASDDRRAAGKALGPLDGIPVVLKDILAVKGAPLTAASKILEDYISPYDGTCTKHLKDAGCILWGRANLDEFAMGSSTENSAFGIAANPWNTETIPGGSSGGSAAAVAAGFAPLAIGSDTGGSIRQPAALCGVVGLKPTYGRVSRYGLAAFASSLDQLGPFSRTAEDAAMLLQVMAGADRYDSTSLDVPVPNYSESLNLDLKGKRIGVAQDYLGEGLAVNVRAAFEKAVAFYKSAGCEIVDIKLPHTKYAIAIYYIIAAAEASSNLARYDGVRYTRRSKAVTDAINLFSKSRAEGFGPEVKRRIMLGTYVLNSGYYDAYYLRAQKARTLMRQDFVDAFKTVDAILTPTTPTVAFKRGEKANDPVAMYLSDIFTIPANIAGICGISFNGGFSEDGLPIGLQLMADALQEPTILGLTHAFETAHDYHKKYPTL